MPAQGSNNWEQIAALVPDRTKLQCCNRWRDVLDPSTGRATARTRKWTKDEVKQLEDAVPAQGRKDWVAISAKVPGRTRQQCHYRWRDTLDSNIDPTTARVGKWTADEGKMLKDAVRAHGAKNWKEIAALVPGRTSLQCHNRWA
jgi:acyl-CoA reductase-like NAD-dependent aldehyde dehydrogenase